MYVLCYRLGALASRVQCFHVLVDSALGVEVLEDRQVPSSLGSKPWSVFLSVDVGGGRGMN